MRIGVVYSKQAKKFLAKNLNAISVDIINAQMQLAMRKLLRREDVAVDVGPLKGQWQRYWRVRVGEIRVIFQFDGNDPIIVKIEKIEYRGSAY